MLEKKIGSYKMGLVFCKSGRRAQLVINALDDNKFEQLIDIEGDMLAWKTPGFPVVR